MIGRLNHVAIAVKDLEKAASVYKNALGAKVGAPLAHAFNKIIVHLAAVGRKAGEAIVRSSEVEERFVRVVEVDAIHRLVMKPDVERCGAI